ncbi:MAG: hypothetical protein LBR90_02940 [Elusimicrobiota bacterium]|jgi:hypothetical protein|nr:hypothetical protein [Elusimicrobiota bacterium]
MISYQQRAVTAQASYNAQKTSLKRTPIMEAINAEVLEQLKNISKQLEKVTKLLEESKTAPAKKDFFAQGRHFDNKKPFGDKKSFGKKDFGKKDFHPRKPRFDDNGKPKFIADGRGYDRRGKRF